jgi:hypothetical protein
VVMDRAAKGRAAMGQAGTGWARMGQVGTGWAKMSRLGTGRSGTGRSRKKLQRTFLLLTGFKGFLKDFFMTSLMPSSKSSTIFYFEVISF